MYGNTTNIACQSCVYNLQKESSKVISVRRDSKRIKILWSKCYQQTENEKG